MARTTAHTMYVDSLFCEGVDLIGFNVSGKLDFCSQRNEKSTCLGLHFVCVSHQCSYLALVLSREHRSFIKRITTCSAVVSKF